jgi:signal peptidase
MKHALLIIAAVAGITIFSARVIVPLATGTQAINIIGSSMEPTLPIGAISYARPVHSTGIEPGDIITFQTSQGPVTHRILADVTGNGDLWTTKGDANAERDAQLLTPENIIGQVETYLPLLGTISQVLAEPVVIAFVVLLVLAILVWPHAPTSRVHH